MAPQHDEIVKHLDDGFSIVWDTTKTDPAKRKAALKVAAERSDALAQIIGLGTEPAAAAAAAGKRPKRARS